MGLASELISLENSIVNSGYVLDPEGTHHEFVSGMHGRKLDFDNITDEDPLYEQWVETTAHFVEANFSRLPEIVIGVANGTNRTALDVARQFDGRVLGLTSVKSKYDSKKLFLSHLAGKVIESIEPKLVVVHEDVGTTGSNSVQVATACRAYGAKDVEVVTTWQRRENLERLEEAGIAYRAMINRPLETYTPEECQDQGFCSKDWKFIPR